MKLIDRYNQYYNDACSGMSHGMPISMEHLQAIAIRGALYAIVRKYNMKGSITVEDLMNLVEDLMNLADLIEQQGDRTVQEVSDVHRRRDLDAL